MTRILTIATILASWHKPTPHYGQGGYAKFYAEDVMERVAVNRGYIANPSDYRAWLDAQGLDGAASLMRRADLGRIFKIRWPDGTITRHISIDCAGFRHYFRRWSQGDVVEVDKQMAERMGMRGPVRVTVIFEN